VCFIVKADIKLQSYHGLYKRTILNGLPIMSIPILSSVHVLRFNTSLIVILVFSLVLLTEFCSGMETDTCWASRRQPDNRCNVDVIRVPMNPCPIIPKTNCYAPAIEGSREETGHYMRTDRAPISKSLCGSAPFIKLTGQAQYFKRSEKGAPYFAANQCPKAPAIVSDSPLRIGNHFKQ
jgi:hypothetical protein